MTDLVCGSCGAPIHLNVEVTVASNPPQINPKFEAVEGVSSKPLDLEVQKLSPSTGRKRYAYTDADFAAFWALYPRKVGKAAAWRKWKVAVREVEAPQIIEACRKFEAQHRNTEQRFIPYPEKWLSDGRWEDEIVEPKQDARYAPFDREAYLASLEEIQ